jgi:hypothetical protein
VSAAEVTLKLRTRTTDGIRVVDLAADYEQNRNDLRRRSRLVWLIGVSFLPGVLFLLVVESLAFGDVLEHFGRWVGGFWLAAFFVANVYRRAFRCPRCQQHFMPRSSFASGEMCSNCGLPLGPRTIADRNSRSVG